jgi:Tol biopolymer transport system component
MPNGKELVFVFGSKYHHCSLWRISASGLEKPRPLPFSGGGSAIIPAVSLENHRLVYSIGTFDCDIWRYQIPRGKEKPIAPSRFSPSVKTQEIPQYSPDGKEVAYVSYASDSSEIWISSSDGSNPLQLTHFGGPMPNLPRWSPDGKNIVFSMVSRGQSQLFTIPAQGGQAKQLTHTSFNKDGPSYSRDGKWVYFEWNRGGDTQIWKMPVEGGEPVQVTRKGGGDPQESMDGRTLFYLKGNDSLGSLWMVPVGGGEETKVLDDVLQLNFDVKGQGIYYLSSTDPSKGARLLYYDLASRKIRLLTQIQSGVEYGFTVSADEDWFLLTLGPPDLMRSNLMLVENFR